MGLDLRGSVSLDGSGWETGLHRLEHATSHFAGELKAMALEAFGIYGVEQAIHKTLDTAKELVTESKRLGIGVEQLQLMKQAAEESNTELGSMAKAFEKIDIAREKALGNDKDSAKLLKRFQQLGISQGDLQQMTAAQMFLGPIRGAANRMSPENLGPVLRDIMGKAFGEMIPVLQTDFEELEEKMRHMGTIMDTETAVKLKMLGSELELLSKILVVQLAPAILNAAEWILEAVGKVKAFAAQLGGQSGTEQAKKYGGVISMHTAAMGADQMLSAAEENPNHWLNKDAKAKAEYTAILEDYQKFLEAGQSAGSAVSEDWKKMMDGIRAKIAEETERLKHPPAPAFGGSETPEEKHHKRLADVGGMVRVGNFLGTNAHVLASIGERQLAVLKQIAKNTSGIGHSGGPHGGQMHNFPHH